MTNFCDLKKRQIYSFIESISEPSVYTCKFDLSTELPPIKISKVRDEINGTLNRLINRYEEKGFAIFEIDSGEPNSELIRLFSRSLYLGEPYVPIRYTVNNIVNLYEMGINIISTHVNGRAINQSKKTSQKTNHAFTTTNEQQLHVDGTLEEIGLIKTSVIVCVTPACSGGDTIIFNSVSAFIELAKHDIDAAISLLDPQCLKRMDLIHGNTYTGPVFRIQEGKLYSRFSLDSTSCWKDGLNSVKKLDKAYYFLKDLAKEGSPFFREIKLSSGQGIIIANDKIAHGRKSYIQSHNHVRTMLRGLFLEPPSPYQSNSLKNRA